MDSSAVSRHVPVFSMTSRSEQSDVKGDDRFDPRWSQPDIVESVTGFGDFARHSIGTNSGRFDWTGEPLRLTAPRLIQPFSENRSSTFIQHAVTFPRGDR